MSYATFAEKYIPRAYPEKKKNKPPVVLSDGQLPQRFRFIGSLGENRNPELYYIRFVPGDPNRVNWRCIRTNADWSTASYPLSYFRSV